MGWYSSRGRGWGGFGFAPYVTVAELEAKAAQTAARIAKKENRTLHGVTIAGRTIAKTFWGKAWCDNIESYRDYAYRLERGRKYVRCGSVIDLEIENGCVRALVCGSGRNPYSVQINIKPMAEDKQKKLVERMAGKISSLMVLAAGKLPKDLLEDFCNPETGLFPKPSEIDFSCSCPDGASCCKYVAAVLYGIGARLDNEPELFFVLRGVDPQSIVSAEAVVDSLTAEASSELEASDLGDVFGIALDEEIPESAVSEIKPKSERSRKAAAKKVAPKSPAKTAPKPDDEQQGDFAAQFKSIRKRLGLSQFDLARRLGTNQTTISLIERGKCVSRAAFFIKPLRDLCNC